MSRRGLAAALLVPLLVVPAGCTSAPSHPVASDGPGGGTSSKDSSAGTSGSPSPMAPARTPLGAGERVWAAFSARDLSRAAWWAGLKPLLSDAARAVYVYDDPRNIPPMTLTGPIRPAPKAPDRPHYTAEVVVPTSKGVFALDLERHTLKAKWLLYAIKFPRGVQ